LAGPTIDEVGRIDLIWQLRSVLKLIASGILSPAGTLLTVLVGFRLILFGREGSEEKPALPQSSGDSSAIPVASEPLSPIFVAAMEPLVEPYMRNGYILFKITVVSCASNLSLSKSVGGSISYRSLPLVEPPSVPRLIAQGPSVELDTPLIDRVVPIGRIVLSKEASQESFTIHRGVSIIFLKQYVSPSTAATMTVALSPQRKLEFYFTDLTLNVLSPESGVSRLPLYEGLSCKTGGLSLRLMGRRPDQPGLSEMLEAFLENAADKAR
jgi:hypothetical protein